MRNILVCAVVILLMLGCNMSPQNYEERNGRWVITGLPIGFPEYSFTPLDSSWEPHPPPADNCSLYFGKKGTGTHIGVFLHSLPPNVGPYELMQMYLQNDPVSDRSTIALPRPFGNEGIIAACENKFTSYGAQVRAFECFVIIPTSQTVIGCTFKRRIEVESLDFRQEEGDKVFENLTNLVPELNEFIAFCNGFREENLGK